MLPFTSADLQAAVADGRVTARRHPTLPYTIYNYSPEVQYSNKWDEVTLSCRGLILDDDFNIVARPWKKFFNLGQVNLPIQFDDPVEVMDKADGSLGILYPNGDGTWAVATRGSFTSEQAYFATFKIWNEKYAELHEDVLNHTGPPHTFLFEIVYPANRIVLNYEDMEDLILLGAVDNEHGYYRGPRDAAAMLDWTGPVVEVMPFTTISNALAVMDRDNAEGYVIRSHNFMVKLKQPDYLDLHRLVTNANPRTVWEQLKAGKSKQEIVAAFPDEFHDYIGSMADPLIAAFRDRVDEILDGFHKAVGRVHEGRVDFPERKDFASVFKKSPDARYFFLLLDGKTIGDVLWAELKPKETAVEAASR